MCFKTKEGKRILQNSSYKIRSGNIFCGVAVKDENRSELTLDITNIKGESSFLIIDEEGKEIAKFINPETGIYRVKLEVNHKYKIKIKLGKHTGKYCISI